MAASSEEISSMTSESDSDELPPPSYGDSIVRGDGSGSGGVGEGRVSEFAASAGYSEGDYESGSGPSANERRATDAEAAQVAIHDWFINYESVCTVLDRDQLVHLAVEFTLFDNEDHDGYISLLELSTYYRNSGLRMSRTEVERQYKSMAWNTKKGISFADFCHNRWFYNHMPDDFVMSGEVRQKSGVFSKKKFYATIEGNRFLLYKWTANGDPAECTAVDPLEVIVITSGDHIRHSKKNGKAFKVTQHSFDDGSQGGSVTLKQAAGQKSRAFVAGTEELAWMWTVALRCARRRTAQANRFGDISDTDSS